MKYAEFKLAKASGGCCHFARVGVSAELSSGESVVCMSPDVFAWLKEAYGPNAGEWPACDTYRQGAWAGATYALANRSQSKPPWKIVITEIQVTLVDSTWDSVALAACRAVWQAIEDPGTSHPYWVGRKVKFPADEEEEG